VSDSHQKLLDWIESDKKRSIELLQEFTRIDTSNPPGDTRAGADFLCQFLDQERLGYSIVAPQETMPNIISGFDCGTPGRHLILNGHIDVFPAGDTRLWSRDPWCGDVVDGRVFGRGTVDMKCGTAASLLTYAYLHRLRHELKGRLTLTVVSDEETGGQWGARYLLENCADRVMGDCVLNAEPSSPRTIRFGEKSILWLTFRVKTPGGHGAYPHLSASATKIAARLIGDLEQLESILSQAPEEVDRALNLPEISAAIDRGLGPGAADVARRLTVNIGTIHGGVKANMLPGDCVIEADIRLPIGLDWESVLAEVNDILKNYPEVSLDAPPNHTMNATWCDPEHEMVRIMQDNVQSLLGFRPPAIVSLGGTDCRFWRSKGVPAYVYGPSPEGMGKPDESVNIDEYLHIVKTHVLSAFDYLSR
jgi:succinyl-diaminopimelate desuccinylase